MVYIIFQYDYEPFLIDQILIGFEAILDNKICIGMSHYNKSCVYVYKKAIRGERMAIEVAVVCRAEFLSQFPTSQFTSQPCLT